jgi:hypothetical protein
MQELWLVRATSARTSALDAACQHPVVERSRPF